MNVVIGYESVELLSVLLPQVHPVCVFFDVFVCPLCRDGFRRAVCSQSFLRLNYTTVLNSNSPRFF